MPLELKDEILISAPGNVVYSALNDPEVLKAAIPGCEELVRHSDTNLEPKVVLKIGPIKARFGGKVVLDQSGAPGSFSLEGEGSVDVAGFAKGGTVVTWEDRGAVTLLSYIATADVGGKIAQMRNRLIAGTAKTLADQVFSNFAAAVIAQEAVAGGA